MHYLSAGGAAKCTGFVRPPLLISTCSESADTRADVRWGLTAGANSVAAAVVGAAVAVAGARPVAPMGRRPAAARPVVAATDGRRIVALLRRRIAAAWRRIPPCERRSPSPNCARPET